MYPLTHVLKLGQLISVLMLFNSQVIPVKLSLLISLEMFTSKCIAYIYICVCDMYIKICYSHSLKDDAPVSEEKQLPVLGHVSMVTDMVRHHNNQQVN